MKLSIIIPVLNSHEIVRRQLLHFQQMDLPDDVELIIVDDGSDPPLEDSTIKTLDTRPWTQPKARNIGAGIAKGDVLIFTDIDHILDRKAIEFGSGFKYDYGKFKRYLGALDSHGRFTQEPKDLIEFGLPRAQAYSGLRISCHTLSMYIRADIFRVLGGFREKLGHHPTHDDGDMKRKLNKDKTLQKCPDNERPEIYMIPNGRYCGEKDYNPHKFFHELKRA